MLEPEPPDGFGDALRLVFFQGEGLGSTDRAKTARPCATFAGDHHCRGALAPAFPAIWALRALADGMQAQIGDERLGRKEDRIGRQAYFDPRRLLRLVQ